MSYCQIIVFTGGLPSHSIDFNNAWGGAVHIWSELCKKYLGGSAARMMDEGKELWALARRLDLPIFERAVLASTFDLAYTLRDNFARLAADLRTFEQVYAPQQPVAYGGKPGTFSHLPDWAASIEKLGPECEAVGFRGTSVSDNPWWRWNEDKGDYDYLPLANGFELYEWLAELQQNIELTGASRPVE